MGMKVSGKGAEQALHAQLGSKRINQKDFLESFSVLPESRFKTMESGLKMAVLKEGKGLSLSKGMRIKVNYTGWLENGKEFDSSLKKGEPFEFVLGSGQVIKGWEEGLNGIKSGERRQLIIPARLAYGNRKSGNIPPGSTLIFNIEAQDISMGHSNPKGNLSISA